uniref:Uncharacterized protein n=1 Tax=Octopus bimaculoides TaxID=37653 RepID=A0A0L8GNY1_OCTBM
MNRHCCKTQILHFSSCILSAFESRMISLFTSNGVMLFLSRLHHKISCVLLFQVTQACSPEVTFVPLSSASLTAYPINHFFIKHVLCCVAQFSLD